MTDDFRSYDHKQYKQHCKNENHLSLFITHCSLLITRNTSIYNKKFICTDSNDVNYGNLNRQKDLKDEASSVENITFRPKIY